MTRKNLFLFAQVIAAISIYYVLDHYIKNTWLLLGVIVVIGVITIFIRSIFTRNDAGSFETEIDPKQYYEDIKKFEVRDSNRYNTLYAYGLSYEGKYEESQKALDKVVYKDIKTSANLNYMYCVSNLHFAYNNKDIDEYKDFYEATKDSKVFEKVEVPFEAFEAHYLLLNGNYETAEEILVRIIPKIRKKILVIELEYLLALAYYNQNKKKDCRAVCGFIKKKDHPIEYTTLSLKLLGKVE